MSNLGKEFVRSAVRQVGKDGGKIISNQLYGDAHSTPIRNVANEQIVTNAMQNNKILSLKERKIAEEENFSLDNENTMGIGMKIFYALICTGISVLSYRFHVLYLFVLLLSFLLFIIGVRRLFRTTVKLSRTVLEDVYQSDKRYRTGSRYAGKQNVTYTIKAKANSEERNELITKGLIYLGISFMWLVLPILLVKFL